MNRRQLVNLKVALGVLLVLAVGATIVFVASFTEDQETLERAESDHLGGTGGSRIEIRRSSSRGAPKSNYLDLNEDEWVPFDETEEERQMTPVWVKAQLADSDEELVGAEVSLLVVDPKRNRRLLVHGRREENGEYFYRVPKGFEIYGLRARHHLNHDHASAFVPLLIHQPATPFGDGFRMDVSLSQAPGIAGRVTDSQTGQILADVEVTVKAGEPRWSTRSDDRGEFRLLALRRWMHNPMDMLQVEVKAKGYVTREFSVDVREVPVLIGGIEVRLQRERRLGGLVMDESGRGILGADVMLVSDPNKNPAPIRALEFAATGKTGSAGRFVFNGLPSLEAPQLRVQARGYLPARIDLEALQEDRGDLRVRLERGRSVFLEPVFPDGSAPQDALLRVFAADDKGDWYTIDLDPMAERRELRVSPTRKTEIRVFVLQNDPGTLEQSWWQAELRYDPQSNLDAVSPKLARLQPHADFWLDHGLKYNCAWGVHIKVGFPGYETYTLLNLHFADGKTRYEGSDGGLGALIAPGDLLQFGQVGSPLRSYLVTAPPASLMSIDYRPDPLPAPDQ